MSATQDDNPQRETWIELALNVALPAFVLIALSSEDRLGPMWAFVLALAFPISHAVRSRVLGKEFSPLTALGLISVLLTGGVGLMELDARWFALKEALIPLVMAVFTLFSRHTRWPVVETMFYRIIDADRVRQELSVTSSPGLLDEHMNRVTWLFIGSFFYSATASYALAIYMVTSPGGSVEFNEQFGQFHIASFVVVGLPMMVVMGIALNGMLNALEHATGKPIDDMLRISIPNAPAGDEG